MQGITTVTTKGQVTIPEPVRSALGIQTGDKVIFEKVEQDTNTVTFKVISTHDIVEKTYGSLNSKIPYIPQDIARQKAGKLLAKKYHVK